MTDPNGNRTAVEIDALGMVVKSAVMGKAGSGDGDTLADPTARMECDTFNWKNHGKPGDNLEDLLADEAVKFISQHKDQPFFLNYWSFQAHSPWQAKVKQIDKYRAKADPKSLQRNPVYAGMVETLDEVVGRLVAALDQAGVLDNTIIIFTSDNGPYFVPNQEHMPAEFHEVPVTNAQPLRAGKGTIYEAGTRVPLVVIWPGKIQPASESNALIQSTDFFPTLADMLGWKLPSGLRFDGISQSPVFEKNASVRNEIYCHFPHSQAGGSHRNFSFCQSSILSSCHHFIHIAINIVIEDASRCNKQR